MNIYKPTFFILVFILVSATISCTNSKTVTQSASKENIEFTEERRLNHTADLKEATIINTSKELIALYSKFKDPNIPRSAPIPAFDESSESIIVIKPKNFEKKYADIEIVSIDEINSTLIVSYKEIENYEFTENQWNNPIVILRISKKPSEIKLNKIN